MSSRIEELTSVLKPAVVLGAARLSRCSHHLENVDRSDTYGPAAYESYIPGYLLFGWGGKWDTLPAAHFTAIAFDLLCLLGLWLVGRRFGGLQLAAGLQEQAQQMQEQMGREMKEMTVDASAGGGAVAVKMRGDFEVISVTISPDLVKDGDVEMIQDLTVAALNEARRKVEESLKGKLGGMLPPGLI